MRRPQRTIVASIQNMPTGKPNFFAGWFIGLFQLNVIP